MDEGELKRLLREQYAYLARLETLAMAINTGQGSDAQNYEINSHQMKAIESGDNLRHLMLDNTVRISRIEVILKAYLKRRQDMSNDVQIDSDLVRRLLSKDQD